ncbi:uncharacterized protein DFL_008862 [Arthrobotrys flagrans]|uniref:BTB domain-containing protein n=1 Tax=Arthrobotrys flagrans TaxID=97331 RepID=A0A436ZQ01_ARTFL|nr:hypothetical protein DFL_008862 [Arthrobotrys flagrans]
MAELSGGEVVESTKYYDIDKNHTCQVSLSAGSSTGTKRHIFRVSESTLRLASSVLARMVDPSSPWKKENDEHGNLTILLHDDDPEALEILFRLIHFQKCHIPKLLGLKKVFRLALVCDKYDCVDVAKPLINEFAADLKEAESQAFWNGFYQYSFEYQPENEEDVGERGNGLHGGDKPNIAQMLLYVSFVFNLEKVFPRAYRTYLMIWQPKAKSEEEDEVVQGPTCLPDRLYAHFMAEWEEKRTDLVKAVNDQIKNHTFGLVYGNQGRCKKYNDCTICDIALYGSFIRRLHYKGIFPVKDKSDALSLYELSERIKAIQIGHYWDESGSINVPHNQCLRAFMKELVGNIETAIEGRKVELEEFKASLGTKRKLCVLEDELEDADGKKGNQGVIESGPPNRTWA